MTEKYQIGIDLGGTNIAAGIVDENFRIVGKASVPTEVNGKNGVASGGDSRPHGTSSPAGGGKGGGLHG